MLTFTAPSGVELALWVLHTKSKISSLSVQDWEEREPEAVLDAVLSRQKLSAEIFRLRERAEQMLASHTTEFHNPLQGGALTHELIDHIVLAPAVASGGSGISYISDSCCVENDAYDAHFDEGGLEDRGLRPSDHRPLSARFNY